jgi:septal ring factor EnvC (AmiA/AmiB activator)
MKSVLFDTDTALDKTKNALSFGAGAADSFAWGILWNACEAETKSLHKDLKPGTEEFYDKVAERFEAIIDHSQVVDGVLQRSQLMRSGDGLKKMATSFMGEPTKQANQFMSAMYDVKHSTGAAKKKAKGKKEKKEVTKPKATVATTVKGPKCMPLEGEIISQYGLQEHPVLHIATRNLGIEIRGKRGKAVRAAAAGTVAMVAEIDGRGPSVIIEHEGGTYSVYGHLRSIRVQEGKEVRNCEEIGEVGDIASLNGIKLYFQVSEGTQTVDPLQWLKQK